MRPIKKGDLVSIDGYFDVIKVLPNTNRAILDVDGLCVVVGLERLLPAPKPEEEYNEIIGSD